MTGPAPVDSDLTLAPAGSRLVLPSASPPWASPALAPEDTDTHIVQHLISQKLRTDDDQHKTTTCQASQHLEQARTKCREITCAEGACRGQWGGGVKNLYGATKNQAKGYKGRLEAAGKAKEKVIRAGEEEKMKEKHTTAQTKTQLCLCCCRVVVLLPHITRTWLLLSSFDAGQGERRKAMRKEGGRRGGDKKDDGEERGIRKKEGKRKVMVRAFMDQKGEGRAAERGLKPQAGGSPSP